MRFVSFFLALGLALTFLTTGSHAQAVLRNGDVFSLRLSGMPVEYANEFALEYTVGDDGEVSIPLIGPIRATGQSTTQLSRAIEKKLTADKIFTSPTVVINLQPQSRFVTVGGGVRAPQAVPWSPDLMLSSAIKRAGGYNEFSNQSKVKVIRDSKTMGIFNQKRIDKDPSQNPKLLPGDEVDVPE